MHSVKDMEAMAERVAAMTPAERAAYDRDLAAHRAELGLNDTDMDMTRAERALRDGRANDVAHELLIERQRQIADEGWTPKHDERHHPVELMRAATAYTLSASAIAEPEGGYARKWRMDMADDAWPWPDGFKPKDARSDLVRAGALIIAAIERLDREAVLDADNLADG